MIATIITLVAAFFVSGYMVNNSRFLVLWQQWNRTLSPTLCVVVSALIYCVVVGGVAVLRHLSMNSNSLDMGLMDQIVWNSAQGRWLEESFITGHPASFLGHHFSPSLALLAPFYWLLPRPETLLVVQVGCITGSGILLYWTGVKLTGRVWVAASLGLMLMLHPLIQDAALYDFHQDAVGMFFLALGLFGISYKRWDIAAGGWLLSIFSKEEIAIYWIAIGAFLLIVDGQQWLRKVAFIFVNVLWLYLIISVFIPYFQAESGTGFLFFERYAFWGRNVADVFHTVTSKPVEALQMLLLPNRIGGLGMMLLPVLLFLVRSHWAILILLIPLGINSFSDLMIQHNYRFHYSLLPIITIVYACIWGIVIIQRKHRTDATKVLHRATLFMGVATFMLFVGVGQFGLRLPENLKEYSQDEHDRIGYRVIDMIPAEASVIAQNKLGAHLSQRRYITMLTRSLSEPAEYYLFDLQSPILPLTPEQYVAEITAWIVNPDYGVLHLQDGYILLKRGASHDEADVQAVTKMIEHYMSLTTSQE
jgi:uncharacterized membrane protein